MAKSRASGSGRQNPRSARNVGRSSVGSKVSETINGRTLTALIISLILFSALTFVPGQNAWLAIHNFLFRLSGFCTYLWPLLLLYETVQYIRNISGFYRVFSGVGMGAIVISLSALIHIVEFSGESSPFDTGVRKCSRPIERSH